MRAGGYTTHQALTAEAAAIVKQALTLARRRGHAQVTPLHVASTMLASPTGLLRAACLQSHSHPLQCKALELCFNVALNRQPTSSFSSPILGGPALSNALVAAFKRAQAHQRRGSIESQQQPLLAVKIEIEQLVISILDDPSVSRVMREAGFSSTQVKANVEKAVSLENPNPNLGSSKPKESEDVMSVIESLTRGKRSVVVVGECLASIEKVVRGVMDRVEKGELNEMLRSLQFITLPLLSFRNLGREEVEQKLGELKCLVRSCCAGRGALLYLGDLKWAAEYRAASFGEIKHTRGYYCPIEHVILEIRSLISGGFGGRIWVMGIATHQTYMKCSVGNPSLEAVLGLHVITIPAAGSLELSLNSDSQSLFKSKITEDRPILIPLLEDGIGNQLTCCGDCSIKFENEARALPKASDSFQGSMISSNLPSWLQQYKEENRRPTDSDKESLQDLCKKWNSICKSTHKHQNYSLEIKLKFSSVSPSSSSISSYEHPYYGQRPSNPNPNSASSGDTMEMEYVSKFKELSAENLKILCNALEKKVSWQKWIIPDITSTILQCRSGMIRRKEKFKLARNKEETWLFFQGNDVEGKGRIARELASLIFGSFANLVSIELSNLSRTQSNSTENLRNKRSRSEASHSCLERFFEAVRENPHRVFLVEDIEQVDSYSQMGIKAAMEIGKLRNADGDEISISDAIIILSCESFEARSRACSPPVKQKLESEEVKVHQKETDSSASLDLNLCVDDEYVEDCSFGRDAGLLESVDRAFFLKMPDDL